MDYKNLELCSERIISNTILSALKPNIHVKGGDYNISQITEKETVERNGGKVVLVPMVKGYSTSRIIERIVKKD